MTVWWPAVVTSRYEDDLDEDIHDKDDKIDDLDDDDDDYYDTDDDDL